MIPKKIHEIWIGEKTSPKNHEFYRETVKFYNPESSGWEFKLWDENSLEAEGINVQDHMREYNSYASASNMIRLRILYKHGGVYLDTDVQCVNPLDPLLDNKAFAAFQDSNRICNAVMGAEPNHPWIEWQIRHGSGSTHRHDAAWGVYTASEAPREGLTIIPTELIYPFHYATPILERKFRGDGYLVHHWEGSWTK